MVSEVRVLLMGEQEMSQGRALPAAAVVDFAQALSLPGGAGSVVLPGYQSVMRWLSGGLRHVRGLSGRFWPVDSALTKTRQRLGCAPLQVLFVCQRGFLAARIPGLDLVDTLDNGQVSAGGSHRGWLFLPRSDGPAVTISALRSLDVR